MIELVIYLAIGLVLSHFTVTTIVGAGIIITVLGYLVLGIMGVMPGQPDENRPESEQSSE